MGLSGYPLYSFKNEDLGKRPYHNVRFFVRICVFELKTWGHRTFVFKAETRIFLRVKNGARASKQNDLGPSQGGRTPAVHDGAQKVNFAQKNACPSSGETDSGNVHRSVGRAAHSLLAGKARPRTGHERV